MVLFIIISIAMIIDIRNHKVPNKLILFGLSYGLIIHLINYGIQGILIYLISITIPIIVLIILFITKSLGAGDIKLLSVVGAFLGIKLLIQVMIYTFIIAAILSLIKLIYNKNLFHRLKHLINYLSQSIQRKTINNYYTKEEGYKNTIPFAVAIFLGVFVVLFRRLFIEI